MANEKLNPNQFLRGGVQTTDLYVSGEITAGVVSESSYQFDESHVYSISVLRANVAEGYDSSGRALLNASGNLCYIPGVTSASSFIHIIVTHDEKGRIA